jgi:hypothetical protein
LEDSAEVAATPQEPMLLILSRHERSVRSTVSFLNRRGIPARAISTLNEALEAFTAKKANMLLLSVNFPHPKIEMIPVLMTQSFPVEVILFAEIIDRKSSQRLQNAKTKHVIMGPVSGPAVMMKIRQIEKELNGDNDANTSDGGGRSTVRSSEQEQSINVRGGSLSTVNKEALATLMSAASEALLQEDDKTIGSRSFGSEEESEFGGLERSGETYVQKGSRSKAHLVTPEAALRAAIDNGLEEADPARKPKLIVPLPEEMRRAPVFIEPRKKYQRKQQAAEMHGALSPKEAHSKANQHLGPAHNVRRKKPESETEALFLRCVEEALETVAGQALSDESEFGFFRKAMLVSIRSNKLKGSFLVAVGKSKHKPADLMERVQVAFFSLVRANGFDLDSSDQFAIELDQIAIASAAFQISDHVIISKTESAEICVAVVMSDDPVPSTEPYEKNMVKVPLLDLPPEEPVTFNVFLHLKRNNKFLRYIKVGAKISDKQVARLEKRKVTHVLVNKDESEAYHRHYAAHSIQPSRRKRTA